MAQAFVGDSIAARLNAASMVGAILLVCGLGQSLPRAMAQAITPQSYTIHTIGLYGTDYVGNTVSSPVALGGTSATGAARRISGIDEFWGSTPSGSQVINLVGPGYGSSFGQAGGGDFTTLSNAQGWVSATTRWTNPAGNPGYFDAWVWSASGGTRRIGLISGAFESARQSSPRFLTPSGKVGGFSARADGTSGAWVWQPGAGGAGVTTEVGLITGVNASLIGQRASNLRHLNDAGQATGISLRYPDGFTSRGQDAWFWDGSSTVAITLPPSAAPAGTTFVGSDGTRFAQPSAMNAAGIVGGVANYYSVGAPGGTLAWRWNGQAATPIGVPIPGDISVSQFAEVNFVDAVGQVVGTTSGSPFGRIAWVSNGATSTRIGLNGGAYDQTGTSFTLPDSEVRLFNDAGWVAGTSRRASTGFEAATDAWVYSAGTSTLVGLTGGVYLDSNGRQTNTPLMMNASGKVVGRTLRLTENQGFDTWYWDGTTTRQIGLAGGIYVRPDGFRSSFPEFISASGAVVGNSSATWSPVTTGQAAWYFDPATGVTTPLIGSLRAVENSWRTTVSVLTDDGYAMGTYVQYTPGVFFSGEDRAFVFRPDIGFVDLSTLVSGGLAAGGWTGLQRVGAGSTREQIVGIGTRSGNPSGSAFFSLRLRSCLNQSDIAGANQSVGPDGVLTADDIIVFLGWFFANDPRGNVAGPDQSTVPDNAFTADDIIVFLGRYFVGC